MGLLKWLFGNDTRDTTPNMQDWEVMKSFCFGIVGDTARLLSNQGFNKPILNLELIIFAMFIVTETYRLSQKGLDKASPQLDQFHLEMVNYVTNEYFLEEDTAKDTNDIDAFHDQFTNYVGNRYTEYRGLFAEDLKNPNTVYSKILGGLLNNLYSKPISEDDKRHLIVPMALKLSEFYKGCLHSF